MNYRNYQDTINSQRPLFSSPSRLQTKEPAKWEPSCMPTVTPEEHTTTTAISKLDKIAIHKHTNNNRG